MFKGKVISTSLNNLKNRLIKFTGFGKYDVQNQLESMPYGLDSSPIKNMSAIYSPTANGAQSIVIGYINKNQLAGAGEFRTFCTDEEGNEKFYTWMKVDDVLGGIIEIGGTADNAVKYSKLEQAFNQLKDEFTAHVHQTAAPGSNTSPPTVASTADITPAKNDKIKTI